MVKCICESKNVNLAKINGIIFFSCLLVILIQGIVDYYTNTKFKIKNLNKKIIILIVFSIIMIVFNSISFEDKENNNEKKKLLSNGEINSINNEMTDVQSKNNIP